MRLKGGFPVLGHCISEPHGAFRRLTGRVVAQLVEHRSPKPRVPGSSPGARASFLPLHCAFIETGKQVWFGAGHDRAPVFVMEVIWTLCIGKVGSRSGSRSSKKWCASRARSSRVSNAAWCRRRSAYCPYCPSRRRCLDCRCLTLARRMFACRASGVTAKTGNGCGLVVIRDRVLFEATRSCPHASQGRSIIGPVKGRHIVEKHVNSLKRAVAQPRRDSGDCRNHGAIAKHLATLASSD